MSRLMDFGRENALIIGTSAIITAGIAFNSYKFVKRIYDEWQPRRWRKVGNLSELWCFPIKSCGPIAMNEIDCGQLGPQSNHIRDRVFMVTHENRDQSDTALEFITARTYPKMVLIRPEISRDVMKLSAPGMDDIEISISALLKEDHATLKARVWKDKIECIDCGDVSASWMSKFILNKPDGLRLVFYPSNKPRNEVHDRGYPFPQANDEDTGAFHDETSYMIMNQGSFDDLNTRLDSKVTPLQYRPNFVVKGPAAWEEDNWKWIKIGEKAIFKVNQPCLRCIETNIDPKTGERGLEMQPLKTLKEFRMFPEISKTSPYFGIHLGVRQKGQIKLGDDIFVAA